MDLFRFEHDDCCPQDKIIDLFESHPLLKKYQIGRIFRRFEREDGHTLWKPITTITLNHQKTGIFLNIFDIVGEEEPKKAPYVKHVNLGPETTLEDILKDLEKYYTLKPIICKTIPNNLHLVHKRKQWIWKTGLSIPEMGIENLCIKFHTGLEWRGSYLLHEQDYTRAKTLYIGSWDHLDIKEEHFINDKKQNFTAHEQMDLMGALMSEEFRSHLHETQKWREILSEKSCGVQGF